MPFKQIKIISITILLMLQCAFLYALPNIKIELSNNHLKQGETLKIIVKTKKPFKHGAVWFNKKAHTLFLKSKKTNYTYISYIGISRLLEPGKKKLLVSLKFPSEKKFRKYFKIWVKKGGFRKSFIKLKGRKKKLMNNYSLLKKEQRQLSKGFYKKTSKKMFRKPFILPAKGKPTTPFGAFRVYNNTHSSKHSGFDIANKAGTAVMAANDGVIIFADMLKFHGGTIMIDHGWGIVTVYNHLRKLSRSVGEKVKRGKKIGEMGSTGISTGSHVHFGLSIQNIRVDPLFWIHKNFLYD